MLMIICIHRTLPIIHCTCPLLHSLYGTHIRKNVWNVPASFVYCCTLLQVLNVTLEAIDSLVAISSLALTQAPPQTITKLVTLMFVSGGATKFNEEFLKEGGELHSKGIGKSNRRGKITPIAGARDHT